MRRVHHAVEDGIGQSRIVQPFVPDGDGPLAGDQRGAGADATVEEFDEIVALGGCDRSDGEVVEREEIDAGELGKATVEGAVAARDVEFIE